MIPTTVRIAIVLILAALCAASIRDGRVVGAALSGGFALMLLYNQFRLGALAAGTRALAQGRYEEARSSFETALRRVEWRGRRVAVAAHLNLAMLDLRARDIEAMQANLEAAYAYKPGPADRLRLDVAQSALLIEQGRYDQARKLLIVLVGRMPPERTLTWIQGYLSLALLKLGMVKQAVDTIGLAVRPATRDRDPELRRLVYTVAAKANDAAENERLARDMTKLAIEHGMLDAGDPDSIELARKYELDGREETRSEQDG